MGFVYLACFATGLDVLLMSAFRHRHHPYAVSATADSPRPNWVLHSTPLCRAFSLYFFLVAFLAWSFPVSFAWVERAIGSSASSGAGIKTRSRAHPLLPFATALRSVLYAIAYLTIWANPIVGIGGEYSGSISVHAGALITPICIISTQWPPTAWFAKPFLLASQAELVLCKQQEVATSECLLLLLVMETWPGCLQVPQLPGVFRFLLEIA